jgi:hypothetical protein
VGHSSAMGQIMAAIKEKRIALGIYERESAETSSFQVKVRAVGLRLTRSFPFNDSGPIDRRRTQVLREAKAWQARNKASAQNHGIAADPVATKASTITLGDWCAQYIADADQTMILQTMAAAKQAGREVSDTRLERLRRLCEVPAQFAALVDPMANDKKSIRRERDMLVVCVQQYADGLMLKHPTEITANDLAAMRDECKRRILPGGGRALSDQSINLRLAAIQSVYLATRRRHDLVAKRQDPARPTSQPTQRGRAQSTDNHRQGMDESLGAKEEHLTRHPRRSAVPAQHGREAI